MDATDVLIIGGGILGCSAAYHLVRRGLSVTLTDKGALAGEATGATTAGLTLQNRTPERLPFYRAAARRWPTLGDELEADLGYDRSGSLTVAHTAAEAERLAGEVAGLQALGLDVLLLSPAETREMAPWLADGVTAVAYCSEDGHVDPQRPPRAFIAAARRLGARCRADHPVTALRRDARGRFVATTPHGEITARHVVNAAGAWAGRVAALLGIDLPVTLDPLQALATVVSPPWLDKVVLHVNRRLTMKQNRQGEIVIGGGWQARGDLDGGRAELRPTHREGNLALARQSVPRLADLSIAREWVGLEGRSPDRYPFFGEVAAVPGFFVLACAHGGFTLSPLLGEQLACLMVDGQTTFPMEAYTCRAFQAAQADATAGT